MAPGQTPYNRGVTRTWEQACTAAVNWSYEYFGSLTAERQSELRRRFGQLDLPAGNACPENEAAEAPVDAAAEPPAKRPRT